MPCYHVIVIRSFRNQASEDVFNGVNSAAARRTCPPSIWRVTGRKLDQLDSIDSLEELQLPPGNRLERLKGDLQGQYSIRINEQYRICFAWGADGPEDVEIVDYH